MPETRPSASSALLPISRPMRRFCEESTASTTSDTAAKTPPPAGGALESAGDQAHDAHGDRCNADDGEADANGAMREPLEALRDRLVVQRVAEVIRQRDRAEGVDEPDGAEGDEHDRRAQADRDRKRARDQREHDARERDAIRRAGKCIGKLSGNARSS